ncbi:TORTIFOLIA1-like protein 4 [Humulus lupulus]|uniref:TORTIFOLIA1-like protein 4 n=1 Tax=Humulus lupulus TaxID=3486 RepID=UPI002B407663|nr:TORTIFOLIA1-like protein 4 [Humulus lupulus]XP_062111768.1 TORTIFOLIA1-like protein 4 [Humulus lupulus]
MSNSRRNSLSGSGAASPQLAGSTQDLRNRVINCLNKLSDRDTLALAAAELESIARSLGHDSFSPFLSCIHNTDDSSKPHVRRQCVSLIGLLSNSHGDSLSPFLPKMISTVIRRLRDSDSVVRSACVDAVSAMSARITRPPFATAFQKPLMDVLSLEQNPNSQIGSALCLAAAIEASPDPDAAQLRRSLPRLGKLTKSDGFKAKSALLVLVGSIVGAGGASTKSALDWLVPSVADFLSSDDWAVRKAAAEALGRVAVMERDLASEYKDTCLIALENRRFDKVKVVREIMNQTLELWKELNAFEEIPLPPQSRSSPDNGIGRCFPPLSKSSQDGGFKTPQQKKRVPTNRSPLSDSDGSLPNSVKKGSPLKSNDRYSTPTMFCKMDHQKKASRWKIEIAVQNSPSSKVACEDNVGGKNDSPVSESGEKQSSNLKLETKHALFNKIREEKVHKFGGLRSGSRVVPFDDDDDEYHGSDVVNDNAAEEAYDENPKDAEDLSKISEQLIQIENQQSSLLDLLQRFIGSSQSGLNSLETRVHGLEIAIDEMSYDLAVSSGMFSTSNSAENTCCKLPGTEFLSSKFWRRAEGHYSSQRFPTSGMVFSPSKDEFYKLESGRFQYQNGSAFFNPLAADTQSSSRGSSGGFSNRMPKKVQDSESAQACNTSWLSGA